MNSKNQKGIAHIFVVFGIFLIGILGIGYLVLQNNQSSSQSQTTLQVGRKYQLCNSDLDCTIAINSEVCCACPESINENYLSQDGWEEYSEDKKYESPTNCDIVCEQCAIPEKPVCLNKICTFETESQQINTEDWKTYRNGEFLYRFNYPRSWEVRYSDLRDVFLTSPDLRYDGSALAAGSEIHIAIMNYRDGFSIEDEVENQKDTLPGSKITNQDIGITEAIKIYTSDLEQYFVSRDKNSYILITHSFGNQKTHHDLVNQILSTFEFIDKNNTKKETDKDQGLWEPICNIEEFNTFTVKVEVGDGITNIARKALNDYLTVVGIYNIPDKVTLNTEERVYAEDYIRKRLNQNLIAGSNREIECELIEDAALKARLLTISQKQNLEKYSENVTDYKILDLIEEAIEESSEDNGNPDPQIITF